MKKAMRFVPIVVLALVFILSECKRDYPSDIPDWLEDKIKDCKKHHNCCGPEYPLQISEWYFPLDNAIIYRFGPLTSSPNTYDYYAYDGTQMCSHVTPFNNCGTRDLTQLVYKRDIYTDKCK